jgi:hypothetical protein
MRHSTTPHPLEDIVLKAFAENDCQDGATIFVALSGATSVRGGDKAYQTVARDVLGYMEDQGLIKRDASGWYRPVANVEQVLADRARKEALYQQNRRPKNG